MDLVTTWLLLWLYRALNFGGSAPSADAGNFPGIQRGPVVPVGPVPGGGGTAPFPAPPPSTLPPFPAGWELDNPPPSEVIARASALLAQLWAKGSGSTSQEMTGGRWITYQAALTGPAGNLKGVIAYRVKGSPGVISPVAPAPMVVPLSPLVVAPVVRPIPIGPRPAPAAPAPYVPASLPISPAQAPASPAGPSLSVSAVQQDINTMGYAPSLVVDGKLGPLTTAGVNWAQRTINAAGYEPALVVDGKPGPLTSAGLDWYLGGTHVTPARAPAPPPPAQPLSSTQVQEDINAMGYAPALVVDGKFGPASTAGLKWAQSTINAAGYTPALVVDGKPGPLSYAGLNWYMSTHASA